MTIGFPTSMEVGISSAEWHGSGVLSRVGKEGDKAAFYVTNFPDQLPLFRLRQAFEVCGIMTDIYIARHRNPRGQEFGFVRYVNGKNKEKLAEALNNVWINNNCVWAREAKFYRFAHKKQAEHARPISVTKKRKDALVKQSVGFMKKIAQMSKVDRKQILHFLKNQKRSKKESKGKCQSTQAHTSTSESSKNSNSSVNNDWENWVILHGKTQVMVDDVKAIRKMVGLKFNCDTANSFNLLTKEGRKVLGICIACIIAKTNILVV